MGEKKYSLNVYLSQTRPFVSTPQYGQITPQLAFKVLLQFDKSINTALNTKVKARVTFKASKLNTYRFCDNVWTLMLNDVEFREVHEFAKVDKVKIVACDGKSE